MTRAGGVESLNLEADSVRRVAARSTAAEVVEEWRRPKNNWTKKRWMGLRRRSRGGCRR
jgi:hypothetical protein